MDTITLRIEASHDGKHYFPVTQCVLAPAASEPGCRCGHSRDEHDAAGHCTGYGGHRVPGWCDCTGYVACEAVEPAQERCDGSGMVRTAPRGETQPLIPHRPCTGTGCHPVEPAREAFPPGRGWRCEACGEMAEDVPGTAWRWAGDRYQHSHGQAGHFDARFFGEPAREAEPTITTYCAGCIDLRARLDCVHEELSEVVYEDAAELPGAVLRCTPELPRRVQDLRARLAAAEREIAAWERCAGIVVMAADGCDPGDRTPDALPRLVAGRITREEKRAEAAERERDAERVEWAKTVERADASDRRVEELISGIERIAASVHNVTKYMIKRDLKSLAAALAKPQEG